MEILIRRRAVLKRKLTLLEKTFSEDKTVSVAVLDFYKENLKQIQTQYDDIHDKIIEACVNDDEVEKHSSDFDDILKRFLCLSKDLTTEREIAIPITPTQQPTLTEVKLPALDLPTFSGEIRDWPSFYDLFCATVHNKTSITPAQKLQYLKSTLRGEAMDLLRHVTITDANYNDAFELLIRRYRHTRETVYSHLKRFIYFDKVNDCKNLQTVLDVSLDTIRALNNLNQPTQHWDTILGFLILEKIDNNTRRDWEIQLINDDIPKLQQLLDFLEVRSRALKTLPASTFPSQNLKLTIKTCFYCKLDHTMNRCDKFLKMKVEDRKEFVKKMNLCTNCLSSGHDIYSCKSSSCRQCGKKHNTHLHIDEITTNHYSQVNDRVLLATAHILVLNNSKKPFAARALFDNGSQSNFITTDLVKKCGLKTLRTNTSVVGISGNNVNSIRGKTNFYIFSSTSGFRMKIEALVVNKITGEQPAYPIHKNSINFTSNLTLADNKFHLPGQVDVLLGAGVYASVICPGLRRSSSELLVAQETQFGWIVSGNLNGEAHLMNVLHTDTQIYDSLEKFWKLEEVTTNNCTWTEEEKECEKNFVSTVYRQKDGRFVVELPRQKEFLNIPGTKVIAFSRLLSLERSLEKDPYLKDLYVEQIQDYLKQGHMMEVPESELEQPAVYLPHHPVVKPSSSTTKVRIVFDASVKTSHGTSLNDTFLNGPRLQQDLFMILIRFRSHNVAMVADIKQMYRQINVCQKQHDLQRILWRNTKQNQVKEYRLTTVTFGTKPAPFLATRVLNKLADDEMSKYPVASMITKRDFYVDDLMTGSETYEEAAELYKQITEMLESGGFELRKWASSCEGLLNLIPNDRKENSSIIINSSETINILGLRWNPREDEFYFNIPVFSDRKHDTKRSFLSDASKVFDPLGFISPVTIRIKILFQDLWNLCKSWDDELPLSTSKKWEKLKLELKDIEHIKVPRPIKMTGNTEIEICGFADASEKAYAAVLYLKAKSSNDCTVRLLTTKTKVAPLKKTTIPRLELCAALLLVRLIENIFQSLTNLRVTQCYAWTDSTITLAWIKAPPSRWKTFVANRVAEIQSLVPPEQWRHVSSELNPADVATRGMSVSELKSHSLWWNGPSFLQDNLQLESTESSDIDFKLVKEEMKFDKTVLHVESFQFFDKFSSFTKLCNIVAYCRRFIHNCRLKQPRLSGLLSVNERDDAVITIVVSIQKEYFAEEIHKLKNALPLPTNSALLNLNPFIGQDGLLRVGGRLKHANVKFDHRHPILLPRKGFVTELIVRKTHIENLHAGPQLILNTLRQKYWILGARDLIRRIVRQCITCHKFTADFTQQLMGNLPSARVNPGTPFQTTGVDFAGPFKLKAMMVRSMKEYKAYIAVFICFRTRAIHLELVSDLSTNTFVAALKRFVARRGKCEEIVSDCGSNFVGTANQLNHVTISEELCNQGIKWNFNPPKSPHFGGLWEAGVKSMKYHLKRIVGDTKLTYEEMSTIICQIEAVLNSRPICPLTSDPEDMQPLTPGHFLIGKPLNAVPERDLTHIRLNTLDRWQLTQRICQDFWRRWSTEYLSRLQQRPKWWVQKSNLTIGDMVLIKEDNLPPLQWKLGRVVQLHPGDDGLVRVVTLKTTTGTMKRPIVKLSILPFDKDN